MDKEAIRKALDVELSPAGQLADLLKRSPDVQFARCLQQVHQRQGYKGFFRGVVDGSDQQKTIKCDDAFLSAIMEDLDKLAIAWSESEVVDEDKEIWQFVFDPVAAEIHRLGEHPGLVPDLKSRENFFAYVKSFCSLTLFRPSQDIEDAKEALVQVFDGELQKRFRSSYDPQRLPWHQFLHHCAPGLGGTTGVVRRVEDMGTRQVIPPGGIRLLCEWEKDFKEYAKEIFTDEDTEMDKKIWNPKVKNERAVGGKTRYRTMGIVPNAPKYIPKEDKQHIGDRAVALEDLSQEYGAWGDDDIKVSQAQIKPMPYMRVAECRKEEWKRWGVE